VIDISLLYARNEMHLRRMLLALDLSANSKHWFEIILFWFIKGPSNMKLLG